MNLLRVLIGELRLGSVSTRTVDPRLYLLLQSRVLYFQISFGTRVICLAFFVNDVRASHRDLHGPTVTIVCEAAYDEFRVVRVRSLGLYGPCSNRIQYLLQPLC